MENNLLIIFVKNPELGKVKSRLAATIGEEEALNIYKQLLMHTYLTTKDQPVGKAVFYSDFVDHFDEWDNDLFQKHCQTGKALGERMSNAFDWAFDKGYKSVCIVGSDCYELDQQTLHDAFERLKTNDVVIGPSLDGGYYLIGMNKAHHFLFKNKSWSTGNVLKETIKDIKLRDMSAALLAVLRDIDVESDLKAMIASAKAKL